MSLLNTYCWKATYDGYESLQLLEQNGGFGNVGAPRAPQGGPQLPTQSNNIHNAGGCLQAAVTLLPVSVF